MCPCAAASNERAQPQTVDRPTGSIVRRLHLLLLYQPGTGLLQPVHSLRSEALAREPSDPSVQSPPETTALYPYHPVAGRFRSLRSPAIAPSQNLQIPREVSPRTQKGGVERECKACVRLHLLSVPLEPLFDYVLGGGESGTGAISFASRIHVPRLVGYQHHFGETGRSHRGRRRR
ncbi:hypothetical protein LZ554_004566 [Drepanopeziza brunnea f. sp. 'monogermtubi']|nr:hypothetical protein LZ554_004566 [Drepanopeziza brunnea f. sp. 'monogermtubi']